MADDEPLLFNSYNAMSRPATHWGIPIMPMLGLVMSGLIAFGAGAAILGWEWGLALALPFLIALLALRLITSVDDRYLRRIRFALRRILRNLKYGKQLLLTPSNPKWSQYYGRRFSQKRYVSGGNGSDDEISRSREHG
ncbi:VirB3 family type IV secretion system protein [Pseudomonas sp. S5F11]|uniref:VirB3 family type IV secretion system protein n=1 Tax=Pseudomonas sp. S5F11 TaxID=2866385 RepID=UPI0028774F93|nr:VirB3 family type IV secretion system protein [Pseudomonas sp. S5F11]